MRNFAANNSMKLILGLHLLLLMSACSIAVVPATQPIAVTGSFAVLLQPLPQEAHRLTFSISELFALRDDGSEIPLPLRQNLFPAGSHSDEQSRLVNAMLPPGRYRGLGLVIKAASIHGEEEEIALLPPKAQLLVEHAFSINDNQAETLFLSLSAERLVTDGAFFTPKFSLWQAERMLTNLKGFVSNSDSQSLTVFNKRTAQVTDSIQVGKSPQDIVLDQRRGWLYVALSAEDSIAVVEVTNGEILGRVRLRFGDKPTELALTTSGDSLLALNRGSDSVSIIDTTTLFERGRVRLTAKPSDIFVGRSETRAYVTHAAESSLSVLALDSPKVLISQVVDAPPRQGVVGTDEQEIYLISDYTAEVLVINAASLVTLRKIYVGNGAQVMKFDTVSRLLYVGKANGEIAVVEPRTLMAIDTFTLPGSVQHLTIDNEENALFAVLSDSTRLLKINLVSKQILARPEVGRGSRAVVVMGER